ncbi:lysophospholipid acyltransferase family protein [Arthrobacter cryoconiti]|uniref:Lysophospholipid acyltransferase family protein n=1 Tax=Arthrobacter cryoconiti TaxID=748907 RepID=A0ABV8R1K5_9MICC|nr:lysophospholipid acyltransferase family protein [Arthrobacter cryoconiti]MCC9069147.1 1-acyl-sn-glycerol-3-phosphate acyltransferase [Arthrobacter cryoconiti]
MTKTGSSTPVLLELTAAPPRWKTRWSRPLGRVLDHVVYRTTVTGRTNIPTAGPVIFAANHLSYLDGPVMVGAASRYMHVMVRHDMFKGFLGRVLFASGQIPVNREGDRAALQHAKAVLERGDCVGILPEGTRGTGDAANMNSGVAWLALNSGATVVPVAILGTRIGTEHRDTIPRPRRQLQVVFGEAVKIEREPGVSGRVSMDRATEKIRVRLAAHIEAAAAITGQDLPADDHHTSKHKGQ